MNFRKPHINNQNFILADNTIRSGYSEHGKSTCSITCPFCGSKTMAYIWSLAGSGKKCGKCKDVLHTTLYSRKKFKSEELADAWLKDKIGE